jgi:histidinol dehydrogenase
MCFLAYGTESIDPVYKIVGPGNIHVARAKKAVYGRVAIDMIAGPSEVCVIGDKSANPVFAAADLLSQAEHDELAASIFITTSETLAWKVVQEVERQTENLERKEIIRKSIENNGIAFIVPSIEAAFVLSNEIAPEHLELLVQNPFEMLSRVKNAGAVFLGPYSPEPLGDYYAGPNHTLPTSGTAKFSSPLGTYDFLKKSSIIYYSGEKLQNAGDTIRAFAQSEGLTAHANSIKVRF